jgi:hypothetical protein
VTADLDLESFARIQARLRAPFADRDAVLHAAGVDEVAFRSAKARWSAELAANDADPLRDRYRAAFAAARSRSSEPPVGADEPDSSRSESETPGSQSPDSASDAPRDDKKFVASYMLASAPVAPTARHTPLAMQPPLGPRAAPPPHVPLAPILAEPARVARPRQAATLAPVASTEPLDLDRLRAIVLADPTPFLGRTSPERLQQLRAEAAKADARSLESPAAAAGRTAPEPDETAMYVPCAPIEAGVAALPFAKKSEPPAPPPDLDVERYAALAAEIQAKGATLAVLARYGVASPGALQAVHAGFERRFTAEPPLRARFEARRAHYLAFMQPTGR